MNKIFKIVIMLLFGGFLGYLFGKYGLSSMPKDLPKNYLIALLAALIPIYFIVVGFHEIGHAVAGKWVGFDFRMYIIGPFFWEKENQNWKFKWNKSLNLSGGMVVCTPSADNNLREKFMKYAAGGPSASLILTVVSLISYFLVQSSSSNHFESLLGVILLVTSFLSFLIFLVTVVPFKAGTFYSDGGRILRLLKNDETSEMEILFLKIMSKTTSGQRYSALNSNDLKRAFELAEKLNDPFKVYLLSYLFHHAFDKKDYDEAESYLNQYLYKIQEIPEAFRGVSWLDASIFYGLARKDVEKCKEFWDKFSPSPFVPKGQIFMAEAILELLHGNIEVAGELKVKALQQLPNLLDKGMAISMKERLASMDV
jgi:tetratricopeptide (TPR) repeat protein